jgi:nicotinate phosphoribosyltransferase
MQEEIGLIKSILDSDLYKFSMQQAICQLFPKAKVRYKFINRGKTIFPRGFDVKLRQEIAKMANLSLQKKEKEFLQKECRYLTPVYLDFLSGYRYDPSEVGVILHSDGTLEVTMEGFWYRTVLWEVPLMALICELYYKETNQLPVFDRQERQKLNSKKMQFFIMNSMMLMEFGTRRRYSFENQLEVCSDFKDVFDSKRVLRGTSNVYIAMLLGLKPLGTHAHEWFMFMAARYGYRMANFQALKHWVDVYNGDLGIALTDTFTTEEFFKTLDTKTAKLFDGLRHDSGDPELFIKRSIAKYNSLNIDPSTKTLAFTNALNLDTAMEIHKLCEKYGQGVRRTYGIGTFCSNDVGVKPLNIVIKLSEAQAIPDSEEWIPAVKLSDDLGKHTGEQEEVRKCLESLRIELKEKVEA